MELSTVFTSEILKAADLQSREVTVVIATVEAKQFNDGNKLLLTFQGKKKALVCNKTNANRIALLYGTDTDGWIGREIVLFPDLVDFQGKPTLAIRVKPPASRRTAAPLQQAARAPAQPTPSEALGDEVPF
jgi:hypothetical protein